MSDQIAPSAQNMNAVNIEWKVVCTVIITALGVVLLWQQLPGSLLRK